MDPDQLTIWQKVMTLSKELLNCARQDNWEESSCHESVRKELLETFFQQSVSESDIEIVRRDLQTIQAWDDETISFLKASRNKVADSLAELRQGRRGLDAYSLHEK